MNLLLSEKRSINLGDFEESVVAESIYNEAFIRFIGPRIFLETLPGRRINSCFLLCFFFRSFPKIADFITTILVCKLICVVFSVSLLNKICFCVNGPFLGRVTSFPGFPRSQADGAKDLARFV